MLARSSSRVIVLVAITVEEKEEEVGMVGEMNKVGCLVALTYKMMEIKFPTCQLFNGVYYSNRLNRIMTSDRLYA